MAEPLRVSPAALPSVAPFRQAAFADGSMFWFSRKTFVGSYSSFKTTRRSYVSPAYEVRAASESPRKLTYARPVDASDAAAITARDHSVCAAAASAPSSRQAVTALSTNGIDRS